jgi:methylenetetrahydrofolate--tRNA-(uracil-5-)-methyltransferase
VIGGGLAGSEAALQLAHRGHAVTLFEMRPTVASPAHKTDRLGELVCSNSMKSDDPGSAAGVLKRELELMGSFVLQVARRTAIRAGGALAVDRDEFSTALTAMVMAHPLISVVREEVTAVPDGPVIVSTGPLTSAGMETDLDRLVGSGRLAFYDAAAPVVDALTLDRSVVFPASRYGKGDGADYLNAPMDEETYGRFVEALLGARRVIDKEFDRRELFAACQPVEEVARTGRDALRFGALKPVGLTDPRTGLRPYAVVQLRAENREMSAYNLVGFQTNLAWPEQRRVFSLIPGLQSAEFVRFGVMHRNTFIDAPRVLDATLAVRSCPTVRIAGQLSGTEGYMEAAASGLLASLNVVADLLGLEPAVLPRESVMGALLAWATSPDTEDYQPMHVNFGIVPPLSARVRGKRERYAAYSSRALTSMSRWVASRPDLFQSPDPISGASR